LALVLSLGIAAVPQDVAFAQPVQYWAQTYGGDGTDYASSARQTSDGGYIVAGSTSSFGAGGDDSGVSKLTSAGDVQWQKTYGGKGADYAYSAQQTYDEGYIVAGAADSGFGVLRLLSDGLPGGKCPLIKDSAATVTATSATASSTAIVGSNTIARTIDTAIAASNTSAATYQQCRVTLPYLRISPHEVSPDQPVSISLYIENQGDTP